MKVVKIPSSILGSYLSSPWPIPWGLLSWDKKKKKKKTRHKSCRQWEEREREIDIKEKQLSKEKQVREVNWKGKKITKKENSEKTRKVSGAC